MEKLKNINRQRLELLLQAMELLEDMHHKMGMFENQRYGKLKGKVTGHTRKTEVVKMEEGSRD
ncbi:hypothetical protein [Mucilaginibacter sp.]|uniref:hypothetical protein n=1 Tax=Mucilaginibacter sp. TaxID=1882438 RepID=UPI0035BC2BE4